MPARESPATPGGELKAQARRELESARSAGAERLTDALVRFSERRIRLGDSVYYRTGQVEVEARHIADVEDIEHFADETKVNFFFETERLHHADILRREVIAKVVIRRKRDRGILLIPYASSLSGGRECPGDGCVIPTYKRRQIAFADEAAVLATH